MMKDYPKSALKRIFKYFFAVGLIFFLIMLGFVLSVKWGFWGEMPSDEELKEIVNRSFEVPPTIEVYTADSVLLEEYSFNNYSPVQYNDLPQFLIDAVLVTEDPHFFEHNGIYFNHRNLLHPYGTITQQSLFNLHLHHSRNPFVSHIKRWVMAYQLESICSKKEILAFYLNQHHFGSGKLGIQAASKYLFGCDTKDLNVQQAATLAGMIKVPTKYNPKINPELSLKRRNIVLRVMATTEKLSQLEVDSLQKLPLVTFKKAPKPKSLAPHFQERVKEEMQKWKTKNFFIAANKSLKVHTTLDSRLQKYATVAVHTHLTQLQDQWNEHWKGNDPWSKKPYLAEKHKKRPPSSLDQVWTNQLGSLYPYISKSKRFKNSTLSSLDKQSMFETPVSTKVLTFNGWQDTLISPLDSIKHHLQLFRAGFMAMQPQTGAILAWVGNSVDELEEDDYVSTVENPIGTAFQPIPYALALETVHPCTEIVSPTNPQMPHWDTPSVRRFKSGLTYSIHKIVEMDTIIDVLAVKKLAEDMGIEGNLTHDLPYLNFRNTSVSLFEMTAAYNVFNNYSKYVEPQFISYIMDENGNTLKDFTGQSRQVLQDTIGYQVMGILEEAIDKGTAKRLAWKYKFDKRYGFEGDMAGKTGTTDDLDGAWFFGMIPKLTAGVWVGGIEPEVRFRRVQFGQGANMALPIFGEFMQRVYADSTLNINPNDGFGIPDSVYETLDCSR